MTTQAMTDEEFEAAVEEHGRAFESFADNVGREYATVEDFEEAYQGGFNSEEDFAQNLAEDTDMMGGWDQTAVSYFDWQMWTRDLFMSDFYSIERGAPDYGVFIFRNL